MWCDKSVYIYTIYEPKPILYNMGLTNEKKCIPFYYILIVYYFLLDFLKYIHDSNVIQN